MSSGRTNGWEVVTTDNALGYAAIDQVRYCRWHGLPSDQVAVYYLVYADSVADQDVGLLLGTDDGCKVWVDGKVVHRNATTRALGFAQDRLRVHLHAGRNPIVVKVVNGDGGSGVSLAIASGSAVQLKTE